MTLAGGIVVLRVARMAVEALFALVVSTIRIVSLDKHIAHRLANPNFMSYESVHVIFPPLAMQIFTKGDPLRKSSCSIWPFVSLHELEKKSNFSNSYSNLCSVLSQ